MEGQSKARFYTTAMVAMASYLGGPLAGSYLMSKNFQTLEKNDYARNTLLIGIASTVVLFGLVAFIPARIMDNIPRSVIPMTYTLTILGFMKACQDKDIKEQLNNNGTKQSGWKVAGITALSLIVTMIYLFTLLLILPENMI